MATTSYVHEELLDELLTGDVRVRVAAMAEVSHRGLGGYQLVCEACSELLTLAQLVPHLRRKERPGALHVKGERRLHSRENVRWFDEDTDAWLLSGPQRAGVR